MTTAFPNIKTLTNYARLDPSSIPESEVQVQLCVLLRCYCGQDHGQVQSVPKLQAVPSSQGSKVGHEVMDIDQKHFLPSQLLSIE